MADNYTQFSFGVQLASPAEAEWIEELVSFADNNSEELPPGELTDVLLRINPDWEYGPYLEFDYQIDGGLELWIHDDGGQGNTTIVANFLGEYLRRFNHDTKIAFEFCWSCSKPRIGEFGGGACVVSANEEKWFSSSQFIEENT